jgi:hypothetical protein
MTADEHKAKMMVLHRNKMTGQDRLKKRIAVLSEKREQIIQMAGGLDNMNESQTRNYTFIQETIEDLVFYQSAMESFSAEYESLYLRQCEFFEKYHSPNLRIDIVKNVADKVMADIETHISKLNEV